MSVFVATVVTMVSAGVETKSHVVNEVTTEVSFREGFLAVTNIIFAYRMSAPSKIFSSSRNFSALSRGLQMLTMNFFYSRSRGLLRLHVGDRGPTYLQQVSRYASDH